MNQLLLRAALLTLSISPMILNAQKDIPPPPKPKDDGPSLAVTMKFIEETINALGQINTVLYTYDGRTGLLVGTTTRGFAVSSFRADPDSCRVDYHVLEKNNDEVGADVFLGGHLSRVKEIVVMSAEPHQKELEAKNGHPERNIRVDPPTYYIILKNGVTNTDDLTALLPFIDERLANRVAKAFIHAVELCGGGNRDPY